MKTIGGEHRSVDFYAGPGIIFYAGPGTIRMNLLKYPEQPVGKQIYLEAHRAKGGDWLKYMDFTVVYSMFDWGFTPEIEKEDWRSFGDLVRLCHQRKIKVFAYIQSSNLVWKEWLSDHPRSRNWLCMNRRGDYIFYGVYKDRYMCCYNSPGWVEHVKSMTKKALNYGADGIYYDNISIPRSGCFCPICRNKFREYLRKHNLAAISSEEIKEDITNAYYRVWCRFRCTTTRDFYREMRSALDTVSKDVPMTSNTFGIVDVDDIVERGFNIAQVGKIQSFWRIENFTLPRLENGVQISNVRTFKVASALTRGKVVAVRSHHPSKGLGGSTSIHRSVYPPEEYQLGIAEATACSGVFLVNGTEYFDKYWTLLSDPRFKTQQEAIRKYNRFLHEHEDLYKDTQYLSNIGLAYSVNSLSWTRERTFPSFCGFSQTLHQGNIPYGILTEEDLEKGNFRSNELVILPNTCCMSEQQIDSLWKYVQGGGKLLITGSIATHTLDGALQERDIVGELIAEEQVTYLNECPARVEITTGKDSFSSHYKLPRQWRKIASIIKKIVKPLVDVETDSNESVFVWKKNRQYILHVVNYDLRSPHDATITLPKEVDSLEAFSPDESANRRVSFEGNKVFVKRTKIYDVAVVYWP